MNGRSSAWWLSVGSLVVVGVAGCTNNTTAPTTIEPTRTSQVAVWGPLAVVEESVTAGGGEGLGPGTLHIGDDCITLRVAGQESTLVWRGAEVAWDSNAREVVFTSSQDGEIRLSDGETILVGGTGFTNPNPTWLSKPNASCPANLFTVHSVVR